MAKKNYPSKLFQIGAWGKPDSGSSKYSEIYLELNVENSLTPCLADASITDNDYVNSSNFPIVLGKTPNDGGQTELSTPAWLSHSGITRVSASYSHLEISEELKISIIYLKIWTNSSAERIWSNLLAQNLDECPKRLNPRCLQYYTYLSEKLTHNVYNQVSEEIKLASLTINPSDSIPA